MLAPFLKNVKFIGVQIFFSYLDKENAHIVHLGFLVDVYVLAFYNSDFLLPQQHFSRPLNYSMMMIPLAK